MTLTRGKLRSSVVADYTTGMPDSIGFAYLTTPAAGASLSCGDVLSLLPRAIENVLMEVA